MDISGDFDERQASRANAGLGPESPLWRKPYTALGLLRNVTIAEMAIALAFQVFLGTSQTLGVVAAAAWVVTSGLWFAAAVLWRALPAAAGARPLANAACAGAGLRFGMLGAALVASTSDDAPTWIPLLASLGSLLAYVGIVLSCRVVARGLDLPATARMAVTLLIVSGVAVVGRILVEGVFANASAALGAPLLLLVGVAGLAQLVMFLMLLGEMRQAIMLHSGA